MDIIGDVIRCKYLIVPSMTGTARDALVGVSKGTLIINTTTNKLNFYNGSAWEAVTSA